MTCICHAIHIDAILMPSAGVHQWATRSRLSRLSQRRRLPGRRLRGRYVSHQRFLKHTAHLRSISQTFFQYLHRGSRCLHQQDVLPLLVLACCVARQLDSLEFKWNEVRTEKRGIDSNLLGISCPLSVMLWTRGVRFGHFSGCVQYEVRC